MLHFHAFLKQKPYMGHCFKRTTFFSPQIKKPSALRGHNENFRNFRETELIWTFLSIFSKRNILYTLKQQQFFSISFCSFESVRYFWVQLCIFFCKLLSATTQQLFCVSKIDIRQGTSNHAPPLYELLVSVVWLTLSFGEVSKTCKRMN